MGLPALPKARGPFDHFGVTPKHFTTGWSHDVSGRHRLRYRNAGAWTAWVADDDGASVDPLGSSGTGPRGLARVPWQGRVALVSSESGF
jgi:hypothetical protein